MIGETTAYQLLNGSEREKWNGLVKACETYDVFFLADYLDLYEQRGEGRARLFVYQENGERYVLYPYLLRNISERIDGRAYFDIATPYGYGGPLYSKQNLQENEGFVSRFRKTFSRYCQSEGIVSEFIRFHPYMDNDDGLRAHMQVTPISEIVYNDLLLSKEDIWANTTSSKKRRIKKSKKNEVEVLFIDGKDITPADVTTFYNIYTETMDKKHASLFYYFPLSFFQSYFQSLAPYVTLAFAMHSGQVISANLMLRSGGFATIHLSASLKEHLSLCPNCNLRYESILWAKENGCRILDHGGGKEKGDSLFAYKQQFSKSLRHYKIGKKVHLESVYQTLSAQLSGGIEWEQAAFFPEYRMRTE
ncbi:GNAT family N-acetyltransferase [Domibacillus sp. A3M-37]|uniref:GNAT family N-acetyltransferase n=1 Tax=Domibacillus sp. A3M-37 TaxID=2962037 RepID=UPI0020B8FE38|nr:GNAT family N-acetyltransferase [Domibacillus sp. A3M-37]MCP3761329.1 GNAT family N-acetyltransferase [Domibacillus sp. A3M-37]